MANFEFTKDGKTYFIRSNNAWDAQLELETGMQIDLSGASYKALDKHHKVIYTGRC